MNSTICQSSLISCPRSGGRPAGILFFLLAALQLRSERFLLLACLLRFCLGFFPCFLCGSFSRFALQRLLFLTPQFFARKRFVRL